MPAPFSTGVARLTYGLLANVVVPALALPLLPLVPLSRKRRSTFLPRLGFQRWPLRSAGSPSPLWVHALSVGELLSAVPLLQQLHERLPDRPLVLSVSTLSGVELARERLAEVVQAIVFFPYDLGWSVRRAWGHIQPALFLLVETDLWPGFMQHVSRRQVPAFLVNGRLSPSTLRSYRWAAPLFTPALNAFTRIYPQSPGEAERFLSLKVSADRIQAAGNLKYDSGLEHWGAEELEALRHECGLGAKGAVLVAGSTHAGEELVVRKVFLKLRRTHPALSLVLVPRHPNRAAEVGALFRQDTCRVGFLSAEPQGPRDVVIVDRLGWLSRLYHLADVAFVGGSLVRKGGQNPIEPAAAGKPLCFGPDMTDFPDISRELLASGGAVRVADETELSRHWEHLLNNPTLARQLGTKARAVVENHRGITRRIVDDVLAVLE